MSDLLLTFDLETARQKPSNQDACPFCSKSVLGKELGRSGDLLWVENLYPTMPGSYQTLIIEGDRHEGDIPDDSQAHNRQFFAYLYECWQALKASGCFASVLVYRNFGPLSGGSLRHPHSQLVGLEALDGLANSKAEHFEGLVVQAEAPGRALVNLSTAPVMGYCEINLAVSSPTGLSALADTCQAVLAYLKADYFPSQDELSYNLFFYEREGGIWVKVLPRLIASPYFLAYGIRLVDSPQRLEEVREGLLTYFNQLEA